MSRHLIVILPSFVISSLNVSFKVIQGLVGRALWTGFLIKDWLYAHVDKPTKADFIKMFHDDKVLKFIKYKSLLEIQNKSYLLPILKKIFMDTRISQNPDKYTVCLRLCQVKVMVQ